MDHRHEVRQVDVGAAELLQGELVVAVGPPVHQGLELPPHDLGGDAVGVAQPGGVVARQLRQSAPRQRDGLGLEGLALGRELAVQGGLGLALEVAAARRGRRLPPHPLVGEGIEEGSQRRLGRRGRRLGSGRHRDSHRQRGKERLAARETSNGHGSLPVRAPGMVPRRVRRGSGSPSVRGGRGCVRLVSLRRRPRGRAETAAGRARRPRTASSTTAA